MDEDASRAEAELEAAKTLTAVKAAAKRLQRAKAALKESEAATERPTKAATANAGCGRYGRRAGLIRFAKDPIGSTRRWPPD